MNSDRKIRLLYIEDNVANIYGVESFLEPFSEYEIVSTSNLIDSHQILKNQKINLILLDLGLPPDRYNFEQSLRFMRETREMYSHIPLLVYSVISNVRSNHIKDVLRCGASYLVKEDITKGADLHQILSVASHGNVVYSQAVATRLNEVLEEGRKLDFTERELQVADLLLKGITNQQIADRLNISVPHARDIVSKLLQKTGAESRTGFAIWYERNKK